MSADLVWKEDNAPFSNRFGDVYFSTEGGLAESRHVFLEGNGLPAAWAGQSDFTIAETGFGTGLNFCAAVQLWLETRPPDGLLHYVSVEGYPLSAGECFRALAQWPELDFIAAALRQRYPEPVPGMHRIHFEEWGVVLTLAIGEVGAMLSGLHGRIDAWFLDGFAPSKNPEMWRDEVLTEVSRLTVPEGSLATFTAVGDVKRGLAQRGFKVRKTPGFGSKWKMIVAQKVPDLPDSRAPLSRRAVPVRERSRLDRVAIVGGGIAGASLVRALRRRGMDPVLYDGAGPGAGASGNAYALVTPRMDAGDSAVARFFAAAYRYATAQYGEGPGWDPCGALVMLEDEETLVRADKARGFAWQPAASGSLLDRAQASQRAGVELDCPGLFYETAGLLQTERLLCDWIGSTRVIGTNIDRVSRSARGYLLLDSNGNVAGEADAVILAAGDGNRHFSGTHWIPLTPVRGQVSGVPASDAGHALKCALSWSGYLSPVRGGCHMLGATNDRTNKIGEEWGWAVLDEDHRHNHGSLPGCLAHLVDQPDASWSGRARLRSATPDRVPLFGAIPDVAGLADSFRNPAGRGYVTFPDGDLLILGGLGSRGFVTAPLAAELLVARLLGEVWPVEESLGIAGDPTRFASRAHRHARIEEFLGRRVR
ncbi:FAD-dependent 5-carboxymethylaminomethyl-2-thiouridine(34) oxidoreductase MnmC [Nisaea denitrificans]|uniref:FAD-dependent 5-carboxymethylaminomethyl-2-thiouridine(34) oxidoreductase MnmC n=1 Tax=Nisaea denitrificans TaxID=390877 RepID=UPI0004233B41|nr:FAD-dependent 5-carboxymethylaminomethyl-2-thiouridine(34) oxidoreductase MnmC [Nisaea denitrificans]